MFETLGFETLKPLQAALIFGLLTGTAFGILAEMTRFCFRRSLVGPADERRAAMGVWMTALAAALLGTQGAVAAGLVSFEGHRFHAPALPALAIVTGGLLFGAGMVLTRGCASRLTVLAGSGNLRAALVLLVFAVTAHAMLRGALAPLRTTLAAVTIPLGEITSLAALPGGAALWTALLAAAALFVAARSGARPRDLALAVLLGLLVPLAWVTTGFILQDEFDPIPMESLSFTAPWAEALFWTVAATSIGAGFGTGLVGGTLAGALLASLAGRRFKWQSFESPRQTGRYMLGAILMGLGGVLAGGCTVGAGLAGVPTMSLAALLALAAIAAGALLTDRVVDGARTSRAVGAA
jgi:uncharacterized membrane protein YedE/YeeE